MPDGKDPPGYVFDDEAIPGYVFLIESHLQGTVFSPDATSDQRDLAARIHVAIDQTRGWLGQVHDDAAQLVKMNTAQLARRSAHKCAVRLRGQDRSTDWSIAGWCDVDL